MLAGSEVYLVDNDTYTFLFSITGEVIAVSKYIIKNEITNILER